MPKKVGFLDAYEDQVFLSKCFIPTRCYEDAQKSVTNFICGRRGSGKSAIVISLLKNNKYTYADHVEGPEFYNQFILSLKKNNLEEIETSFLFKTIWKHLILITAMNSILTPDILDLASPDDKPMYDYLKNNDFYGKKPLSTWQKIISTLKETLSKSSKHAIINELLNKLTDLLENKDFRLAEKSLLYHINKGRKCLIVVDTILDYFKKEAMFVNSILGLITAVLELTSNKYSKFLEIKCCIPGEVYPQLQMWEAAKVDDHMVFLTWSPKDLTRMVSKRMMYHLLLINIAKKSEFNSIDWRNYKEVKRNVWDRFVPDEVINLNKLNEKTHRYILRHTQQTPRELIRLMNEVIGYLEYSAEEQKHDAEQWKRTIIEGVHKTCAKTVNELIYSNKYLLPKLREILTISFQSKPKIMNINDVKKYLFNSKELWGDTFTSKEHLMLEALIKIGFLGLVLHYPTDKNIVMTSFSYLNPDVSTDPNCFLAIHPMFYEMFNIKQEDGKIIQPTSNLFNYLSSIYHSDK